MLKESERNKLRDFISNLSNDKEMGLQNSFTTVYNSINKENEKLPSIVPNNEIFLQSFFQECDENIGLFVNRLFSTKSYHKYEPYEKFIMKDWNHCLMSSDSPIELASEFLNISSYDLKDRFINVYEDKGDYTTEKIFDKFFNDLKKGMEL